MLLTSTFSDIAEGEALRELHPGGEGDGADATLLPTRHGRLASWLSAAPSPPRLGSRARSTGFARDPPVSPAGVGNGVGNGFPDQQAATTTPTTRTSKAVRRGDVVAVERPLVAAQTSGTLPWVAACPGCLRHVGGLDAQLAVASGARTRAEAFRFGPHPSATTGEQGLPVLEGVSDRFVRVRER
ncbi:unnamed protein product [Ectocarpus sp. 4 AP-2014]